MAERQNGRALSEHTAARTDQELCPDRGGGRQVPSLHCQETGEVLIEVSFYLKHAYLFTMHRLYVCTTSLVGVHFGWYVSEVAIVSTYTMCSQQRHVDNAQSVLSLVFGCISKPGHMCTDAVTYKNNHEMFCKQNDLCSVLVTGSCLLVLILGKVGWGNTLGFPLYSETPRESPFTWQRGIKGRHAILNITATPYPSSSNH